MQPLDISEYELDAFTLLSLRGVFDPTTADQLWDRVLHHTARGTPVVVHCGQLVFSDANPLDLATAAAWARATGADIRLIGLPPVVDQSLPRPAAPFP